MSGWQSSGEESLESVLSPSSRVRLPHGAAGIERKHSTTAKRLLV